MHCRMHSSILGLNPLDASSWLPQSPPLASRANQKCLQMLPSVPWGWIPPVENNCFKAIKTRLPFSIFIYSLLFLFTSELLLTSYSGLRPSVNLYDGFFPTPCPYLLKKHLLFSWCTGSIHLQPLCSIERGREGEKGKINSFLLVSTGELGTKCRRG